MNKTCSIIIPLFNGEKTIIKSLESLIRQKDFFNELIIVNDASLDNSIKLVDEFLKDKNINYKIITHPKNKGLAASYNTGIKNSTADLVVLMHQDVVLFEKALQNLIQPFKNIETQQCCVSTYHYSLQPWDIWQKYNFWQKYFFCRWVNKKIYGMNGKFDCFKKQALLDIGLFDEKTFHSAGEDADILIRLAKKGKIIKTEAGILHLHDVSHNFGIKEIIKKQTQMSESQGVLYKKHGCFNGPTVFIKSFFRELLVISLFIPYLNLISLILIIFYSFFISRVMYLKEYKNPLIIILPFLNIYLLFVSLIYSINGYINKKQKL